MLHTEAHGRGRVTIFFLHFLGGTARQWRPCVEQLREQFRCVAIDLPGFGQSAQIGGYTVEEMAGAVSEVVRREAAGEWVLVGHSMGAKVGAVVARWAEDGRQGLEGLRGLVLLAGSPPAPEPMAESRRSEMLGWFTGDAQTSRKQAERYIDSNGAGDLAQEDRESLVQGVLQMHREAWVEWLEEGSREDWSRRVGVLRTPATIAGGSEDRDLGPDAQSSLMLPHFAQGRVVAITGARHLLPVERAAEVAAMIRSVALGERVGALAAGPVVGAGYAGLIDSDRVSAATRAVLQARAVADDPAYRPRVLTVEELWTLRAVVRRIVPQPPDREIDLAARLDRVLAGPGDGWRFAELPQDAEAWRAGLLTLEGEAKAAHGRAFGMLDAAAQDELLARACAGGLGLGLGSALLERAAVAIAVEEPSGWLTGAQMKLWFKDLCAEAVRLYVAHPATLERMGYSGIADGADPAAAEGFVRIGLGERERWEPVAKDDPGDPTRVSEARHGAPGWMPAGEEGR